MKLSTLFKEVTQLSIFVPRIGPSWFPPLAPFGLPFGQPGAATVKQHRSWDASWMADCGLHITDLARGFHFLLAISFSRSHLASLAPQLWHTKIAFDQPAWVFAHSSPHISQVAAATALEATVLGRLIRRGNIPVVFHLIAHINTKLLCFCLRPCYTKTGLGDSPGSDQ